MKISFYQLELAKTSSGHKILLVMLFQCNLREFFSWILKRGNVPNKWISVFFILVFCLFCSSTSFHLHPISIFLRVKRKEKFRMFLFGPFSHKLSIFVKIPKGVGHKWRPSIFQIFDTLTTTSYPPKCWTSFVIDPEVVYAYPFYESFFRFPVNTIEQIIYETKLYSLITILAESRGSEVFNKIFIIYQFYAKLLLQSKPEKAFW